MIFFNREFSLKFPQEGGGLITGSAVITVKKDVFGIPHLFCVHFVPFPPGANFVKMDDPNGPMFGNYG